MPKKKPGYPRTRGGKPSLTYSRWLGMIRRCTDRNTIVFKHYMGAGIRVCSRWLEFQNFVDDMGPLNDPSLSIDRIDPLGNYCPENCRWATREVQALNRRGNLAASSKYKGVSLEKSSGLYRARIKNNKTNETVYIGRFQTEKKAAKAYNDHAVRLYGDIAFLNKI